MNIVFIGNIKKLVDTMQQMGVENKGVGELAFENQSQNQEHRWVDCQH